MLLALRLRILAAVLGMFSDAEDSLDDRSVAFADDRSAGWPTVHAAGADAAPHLLLLIVSRPAARRTSRPP